MSSRRRDPLASCGAVVACVVLLANVGCDRGDGTNAPDGARRIGGEPPLARADTVGEPADEGDAPGSRSAPSAEVAVAPPSDASPGDAGGEDTPGATASAGAEGEDEPEQLVPMGTAREDAIAILAEDGAFPDDAQIEECGFRKGGKTFGEAGRVDIIECVYADTMAYVSAAWIVIRPSNLAYEMTIEELSSVTEVPGETGTYSLGPLMMKNGTISIRVKEKWTTYGNTGDPDAPADKSVERVQKDFVCFVADGVWECNRTVAP